jgi:hypothetical protein
MEFVPVAVQVLDGSPNAFGLDGVSLPKDTKDEPALVDLSRHLSFPLPNGHSIPDDLPVHHDRTPDLTPDSDLDSPIPESHNDLAEQVKVKTSEAEGKLDDRKFHKDFLWGFATGEFCSFFSRRLTA